MPDAHARPRQLDGPLPPEDEHHPRLPAEDYADGRAFWPKEAWRRFARTSNRRVRAADRARRWHATARRVRRQGRPGGRGDRRQGHALLGHWTRLNFLVADALELVPDALLEYLARLRTPEVFRFCAIPQVMAIATLEACFDNPQPFTGVVKIRKGLTARLDSASLDGVHFWFCDQSRARSSRACAVAPSRAKMSRNGEDDHRSDGGEGECGERAPRWAGKVARDGGAGGGSGGSEYVE